jgi:Domain of unknown function (DUF222)
MAVEALSAGVDPDGIAAASRAVVEARRDAAAGLARLAAAAVRYADVRRGADLDIDRPSGDLPGRVRPGEFAADELAPLLRQQPWHVRCLVARTRRVRSALPAVWDAFAAGDLDADQVAVVDRVARRATQSATLAAIDDQAVEAAATRSPKQLGSWLLRLILALEPDAFAARHRRALAERGVTVQQGPDGVGYLTAAMSADAAAAIDILLSQTARSLGADDPRSIQQRRADLVTDLLLGRLHFDDDGENDEAMRDEANEAAAGGVQDSHSAEQSEQPNDRNRVEAAGSWIEIEDIDLDTGELRGSRWQWVDADGIPADDSDVPADDPAEWADGYAQEPTGRLPASRFDPGASGGSGGVAFRRRPQSLRIGIVVPLSSLIGLTDTPAQLPDRSSCLPADTIRNRIADLLDHADRNADAGARARRRRGRAKRRVDEVLFTRLLTDDGGRLLQVTELGRSASRRLAEAIRIRAGTCRYPTCTVPADLCDLDHHDPQPRGPTSGANEDPGCRRHHRGKTFAWIASRRDHDAVCWTLPGDHSYRVTDDPLPTGVDPPPDNRSPDPVPG